MEIKTKYHGEVQINDHEVINFVKGIPGFPNEENFTILSLEEDGVFSILQSVVTPELAFVIVNPFHYFKDYDFHLEDQVVEALSIKLPEEVQVFTILTVQEPFEKTTANLQAPLIINKNNRMGKQVVLNNEKYTTRHKILGER
ncbi:Flagellar assembly factor FliW [Mycobacteroides abscessus subsp. abscessus]|nr:Flagellar assembly factor FliW [Mycobacteroides abscessus subsp. abscessus]